MNINIGDLSDVTALAYINMMEKNGFRSQINQPTRETENNSSIIDHVFVKLNANLKINSTPIVLKNSITDHYPVIFNIEFNETSQPKPEKEHFIKKNRRQ